MRTLPWNLFVLVSVGSPTNCGGWARLFRALLWPLFGRLAWGHPATVVADTTVEGADRASVLSIGLGSATHCGVGHDN
jgi:hypothetical protein